MIDGTLSRQIEPARLREYQPRDFARIVALDQACFEPGIAYSGRDMRRFLSLATRVALVGEIREELVGFCIGYRGPSATGHILTLDVGPTHRRSGIGRRLLEETARRLAAAGARETVLEVDVRNAAAIAFYDRLGFRTAGEIPDYYGRNRPAFQMSRDER